MTFCPVSHHDNWTRRTESMWENTTGLIPCETQTSLWYTYEPITCRIHGTDSTVTESGPTEGPVELEGQVSTQNGLNYGVN